jgi:anti-sigma regulatory factor (Ser/Thr protein kinase)
VRHAYGPADATFRVSAARDSDAVALTVKDAGHWRPPRGEHGGRGLVLMRALCDEVEIEKAEEGTTVTLRRFVTPASLPSSAAEMG